jgi:DNA polymerase/3'-5' exonuclease PolX
MGPLPRALPDNRRIAERLSEAARLLQSQGASRYRVNAYRNAARGVAFHPRPLPLLFAQRGVRGLDGIPGVGLGIAAGIAQMLASGRWSLLEHLRASSVPCVVLQSVPGMGPALARHICDELHIATLQELHEAAHDGRLEALRGVGARRARAWRAVLDDMLDAGDGGYAAQASST